MDRDVTIRFYEIVNNNNHGPSLEGVLRELIARRPRQRESDAPGVRLRLEHLREDAGLVIGDLTRVQTQNLPGHVTDDNTDALPVAEIGHWAAFCYDPQTRVMALQFDLKIGVGRLCAYLSDFGNGSQFSHLPVLTRDALERFRNERPTKLTLQVSRVRNFRDIHQGKTDFEEALENFGELFDAPIIEVSVSTRGEDRTLDEASTWNTIRRWLSFRDQIDGIKKITACTIESDDAFNFIKELLKEGATLDLPDNDPPAGRLIRTRYARECYEQHRGYLRGIADAG